MSDSALNLSFAEISFVMALVGDDLAGQACERLGVPITTVDDPVSQAGVAGLALRDLAREAEGALELAPPLAAVVQGLRTVKHHATVSTAVAEGAYPLQIFVGDDQSLVVRPLALGCFRFDALDSGGGLPEVVTAIVCEPREPRVVMVDLGAAGTVIVSAAEGTASISTDGVSQRELPLAELETEIREILVAMLGSGSS